MPTLSALQRRPWPHAALHAHPSIIRANAPQAHDLLALLEEQGPSTGGIFQLRQARLKELREALDRDMEVNLESQPARLAVVVKDFLRNTPFYLLNVELYEEWMSTLQKTSRQQKLQELRDISKNTDTSRMTASNLAICVGSNLLSPIDEHTFPLEVLMQVMGLVQFLLDNSEELFGEEVAGLSSAPDKELPAPVVEAETAQLNVLELLLKLLTKQRIKTEMPRERNNSQKVPLHLLSPIVPSHRGPSSMKTLDVAELVAEVHNWPLEHNLQP
ncbi:t-cell activation rho gtpase-activating hypothetical protein [Limosa lapponica baueri]|uniref:Rho-GAP domain-containing protein n=1 Tax=Limosa lapponica baueri TaxID=1758121 RepID=A0A2I0U569_LIMLA|nr:t-cell activation rho gtpase-activating hypothetical protein [Limosa lapponica baueri]